ncbi:F-box domain [Arabidopsis thaliana x Arabidopsis arenosa]|uniref:F-box domain n=1 Tax=Arabidopsis thaliana x Arabidopsis arenosa TaxID=1240361 RepID=A0A8T2BLR1_9BRAS|nr:F-box domain [Arabidopsis thaliana x Arabidopsis arenosa]
MDEDREKHVRAKGSDEVDWISKLPDCLLCEVLLNLPTKDVVKTSVLSTRWRNLWKHVPGLDLDNSDFQEFNTFLNFVDSFLDFNSESCLETFMLKYDYDDDDYEPEISIIGGWINTIVTRNVKHIDVLDDSYGSWEIQLPSSIYTSKFADNLALETLITKCPVLESLIIERCFCDDIEVLRVRSQSLLSFTHVADSDEGVVEDLVVEIDAPKLEYLRLSDHRVASFIINKPGRLVEADIDIVFNLSSEKFNPDDLPKRTMIRNFLVGISTVKDMVISSSTLEVIYDFSRCERLPLFRNLSVLRVEFYGYRWEMLPIFLESCPNLKTLVVKSARYKEKQGNIILSGPRRFLSSLEYVKIERPLKGDAMEMKLVSYLLENSTILKKLTLCLDDSIKKEESVILKELLAIPRLSTPCKVVVL